MKIIGMCIPRTLKGFTFNAVAPDDHETYFRFWKECMQHHLQVIQALFNQYRINTLIKIIVTIIIKFNVVSLVIFLLLKTHYSTSKQLLLSLMHYFYLLIK